MSFFCIFIFYIVRKLYFGIKFESYANRNPKFVKNEKNTTHNSVTLSVDFKQSRSDYIKHRNLFFGWGDPFYVIINGIKQNKEPRTNVKITGLTSRSNQVRIIFKNEKIPAIDKSVYFEEMGFESTMKITKTKKKGYKLRYFDHVAINLAPKYDNQFESQYVTSNTPETKPLNPVIEVAPVSPNAVPTPPNNVESVQTIPVTPPTSVSPPKPASSQITSNASTSSNASSSELYYRWTVGSSYHFSATVVDNITTAVMGMNMKETIKTATDFVLYIDQVASNGYAMGTLYLVNFQVTDSRNQVLASLKDIPSSAIKSQVTVDRKGKFTFPKKVFLITTEKGNVLAYGNASENLVQTGAQAGNIQVDAYAEFDPKTGALKTGYTVKEIKNTRKVAVQTNEETQMVDIFPYDFLEMLVVPDGAVQSGDQMEVKAGMYSSIIRVETMENGLAKLNTQLKTDKSADMFGGGAKGNVGGADVEMQMDSQGNMQGLNMEGMQDMMNMGGMEMSQEDKQVMDMTKAMSPTMSGNIDYFFNYEKGMFDQVFGTINTAYDAMGMKISVQSVLNMKKM